VKIQPQWVVTPGKQKNKQTGLLDVGHNYVIIYYNTMLIHFFSNAEDKFTGVSSRSRAEIETIRHFFLPRGNSSPWAKAFSLLRIHEHPQTHHRTPLDE
jgi:hypothetical protein